MAITGEQLQADWKRATAFWGLAIQAGLPRLDPRAKALAFIDLETRQVTVNPRRLEKLNVEDCLLSVLAHELGHHLRYPCSLSTLARLELFERELLPVRDYSLLNLFTDTLINLDLGQDPGLRGQLVRIFSAMPRTAGEAEADPSFFFYLTCLEEAWGLEPHTMTGEAGPALEKRFPGCRAEAQLLSQELPNLAPNIFTQLLYFASVLSRFQRLDLEGKETSSLDPMKGDLSAPGAGDYADAIERSTREAEAIRRALEEGWLRKQNVPVGDESRQRRIASLPGICAGEPKKLSEIMAMHYRRLAERHLFQPPPRRRGGEPLIPSTLAAWEPGDSPRQIDWLASVIAAGPELGSALPLKRELIEDDPELVARDGIRRLEIYLDVSGSMPDPKLAINPMTLAAQVLCLSAIRAGGQVRALIYSTNHVDHWAWTRSEREISGFLMSYIGGGTDFPFDRLERSIAECGLEQPIRVVLTDADFSVNLAHYSRTFERLRARAQLVALLNNAGANDCWVREIADRGVRTVPVESLDEFPNVAAALARALFGDPEKGVSQ